MQQQAAIMAAAAAQGSYLTNPMAALAAHVQQVGALGAPNGLTTAAITPTTTGESPLPLTPISSGESYIKIY